MFLILLAILKFWTDQRLFWRSTLMSVRRKASVVIMFRNVSDFSHHPWVLMKGWNITLTKKGNPYLLRRLAPRWYREISRKSGWIQLNETLYSDFRLILKWTVNHIKLGSLHLRSERIYTESIWVYSRKWNILSKILSQMRWLWVYLLLFNLIAIPFRPRLHGSKWVRIQFRTVSIFASVNTGTDPFQIAFTLEWIHI